VNRKKERCLSTSTLLSGALGLMSFSSEVNVLLYQANLMQANALQRLNSVDAHHNLGTETAMV
jgi:hypothetical protein